MDLGLGISRRDSRQTGQRVGSGARIAAVMLAAALVAAACGDSGTTVTAGAGGTTGYPVVDPAPSVSSVATTTQGPPVSATVGTAEMCPMSGPILAVDETAESPATQSDADHVRRVGVDRVDGCGSLVIELGADFSYQTPGPSAARVPTGTTVTIVDNTLRVGLSGIDGVRFQEVPADVGEKAILARKDQRSRDLEVVVFSDGEFTGFSAEFLGDPARIAVEFSERPLSSDDTVVPLVFDQVILESITSPTGERDLTAGDIVFTGYARPFEAQMEVELIGPDGAPSAVVCANGCYITGEPVSRLGVPATDWGEAWGEFTFALVDLAPGEYMIRLSNDAGAVDTASWVDVPFVVRP